MDQNAFWLADISDHSATLSFVNSAQGKYVVSSIGPSLPWDESNPESFVTAIDQSLSESASTINLPQESEPNTVALIIPPFWVGSDGKIVQNKLKLLESMFRELKLKPMGFISNDEAIVEAANIVDGFPASFVLVNITATEIIVSLTYLGKVTERVKRNLPGSFDPELLESAILEFKSESALPPQIILFGQIDDTITESVKNFPWIGKKNVETFLHFPEVKYYSQADATEIFSQAITSQFSSPPDSKPVESHTETTLPAVETEVEPEVEIETSPPVLADNFRAELVEVSPDELGFVSELDEPEEVTNFTVPESIPEVVETLNTPPVVPPKPKLSFKFPQLKPVKFRLPLTNFLLLPVVLSPLLLLIPFLFSTAHLTLYLTPYQFNKTLNATFDPQAQSIDFQKKIIPINRKTFQVKNSLSLPTTGQKTVGDKAKGEVTVFNKQDKVQNLPSGTILIDSQGSRYTLDNSAQVPASSSNFDLGVITLGQVKVSVSAADIGPEFNLAKDSPLHFKDFAESLVIAKANTTFAGGSKKQISAVSATDKQQLEAQLTAAITTDVKKQIDQQIEQNPEIIRDSVQIQKGRIDYNREVGEEADQLTGDETSTVYVFSLDPTLKANLINTLLSNEPGFSDANINPSTFNLSISSSKSSVDKISGLLTISGSSLPKVSSTTIAKMVSGKSQSKAAELIKRNISRVYNFKIDTNFSFIRAVNPLPFRIQNIIIEFK